MSGAPARRRATLRGVTEPPAHRSYRDAGLSAESLARALEAPDFDAVRTLDLSGCRALARDAAALLGASGRLAQLEGLDLSGVPISDTDLAALLAEPDARGLRRLSLRGVWPKKSERQGVLGPIVGDRTLEVLAGAAHLALRELALYGACAGRAAWGRFFASPVAAGLVALDLHGVDPLEARSRRVLHGNLAPLAAGAGRLRALSLDACQLSREDVAVLVAAPFLASLERLSLAQNKLDHDALRILAAASAPALTLLDLGITGLDEEGVRILAGRAGLPALRRLGVDGVHIPTGARYEIEDQGMFMGTAEELLYPSQIEARWFAGQGVSLFTRRERDPLPHHAPRELAPR